MTQPKGRPLSAEAAAVVKAMSGGRLSRRSLMAGAGAAGAGAFLASCGTSGAGDTTVAEGKPSPAADRSKEDKSVNWTNWTLYLDYDEETKTYPSLEAFQTATGIKTTYSEDIEDNASYYAKIQPQISRGQDFGADIVVFTDWMMSRMIREGYAQKFDKSVMPNVTANLLPTFAELKGRIEVLSEMRDTMGLIMMDQGADITKFTAAQFDKALSELETQLSSGQIRQVRGNSYAEDLTSGDALAVIGWSGDIIQLQMDPKNEGKFEFALPEGGGHLWADNMFIPITSPHKENAEILINYYYDPKVAAEVAAYVNYICPVKGAEKYVDPELADNYMIFPKGDENVQVFRTLTAEEQTAFSEKFQAVLGV
ncbi:MAG: spermidine/putrescine ABC transporter substrate-binding protein [Kineosporiaceae bacterium]